MALDPDPYRTLGLKRGATLDEVKRAYRRLAKINHPDAAGEAALPRFLAIQAAYEQLAGPASLGKARRPTPAPRRPWDAEADKTRRAYGGRARNAPPGAAGAGGAAPTGKGGAAGAGGEANPSGGAGRGERRLGAPHRIGGAHGRGVGTSRPAANLRAAPRVGDARHAATRRASARTQQGDARIDVVRRGRHRAVRARLGRRQLVRHHQRHVLDGEPEGIRRSPQARAGVPGTRPAGRPSAWRGSVHAGPDARGARRRRRGDPGDPATRRRRPAGRPDPHDVVVVGLDGGAGRPGGPDDARHGRRPVLRLGGRRGDAATAYGRGPADTRAEPPTGEPPPPDLGRAAADITHALTDDRFGGSRGRLARALIGWLPIALGLSWLVGEMTGCGRFAATCDDGVAGPMLFVLQILAFARAARDPGRRIDRDDGRADAARRPRSSRRSSCRRPAAPPTAIRGGRRSG